MAKKEKEDKPSVVELESDLKAIEEQVLLYAKDLARIFAERKEKERQLELTQQQLARSARIGLLGELAAGIAHEINNILTPATGNLSMLLMDRGDLPNKVVERLELIEESLMAASSMLHQVLDFSRKEPEKREPVDIKAILDQSLSLLEFKFAENQIVVEKDLQSNLPKLEVDDAQIGQVFTNLTLNAMDAMEPGGTLRFAISHHLEESAKQQPYVQILIEDTGRGIPPEVLEHVFEPFYTTKGKGLGTGLGLFICYGIIEKHGGTMDVASAPDEGTQFKICLPVS
jgi:two-component system NtrC family sensor kinase